MQTKAEGEKPRDKFHRCQFPSVRFIFLVAASVSEWIRLHSLTLAATLRPSRDKLRGTEPIANEATRQTPKPTPGQVTRQGSYLTI